MDVDGLDVRPVNVLGMDLLQVRSGLSASLRLPRYAIGDYRLRSHLRELRPDDWPEQRSVLPLEEEPFSLDLEGIRMSIALAIKACDGIVLATDSRRVETPTMRYYDDYQKLLQVRPRVGLCICGTTAYRQRILYRMMGILEEEPGADVLRVAEACAEASRAFFTSAFPTSMPKHERDPQLQTNFLVGGLSESGEPAMYTVDVSRDFGPDEVVGGYETMGVPDVARYILEQFYDGLRTAEELARLAAYAVTETNHILVGGPVQLATVTEAGYRQFGKTVIGRFRARNAKAKSAISGYFWQPE